MKLLVLAIVVLAACGSDPKPVVTTVAPTTIADDRSQVMPQLTLEELLSPQLEQVCSSSSDCAGFGKCSGGKCGSCSSSSDCKGGKCNSGRCSNYTN